MRTIRQTSTNIKGSRFDVPAGTEVIARAGVTKFFFVKDVSQIINSERDPRVFAEASSIGLRIDADDVEQTVPPAVPAFTGRESQIGLAF